MGTSTISSMTDGYAQWYADRLWMLLPAVYRSLDVGPTPTAPGPLREVINRIGAQAAVVRQSIDRMGENQSIETCDDWAIPYIGDLVATRIVSCLDAAAQRIDVAKTIYYRRRAGTVGLLEELAADIASADARVVEFFRRLGRTRHQFDPPLSYSIENPLTGPLGFTGHKLQIDEGLIGRYSETPAGGFADLRKSYAASKTGTAFDEYAYTADLRSPGQAEGWYNIRNVGVFVWWLGAWPIYASTPVPNDTVDPTCFTFDPTGRSIPLFAPSQRAANPGTSWGEDWKSPDEWMLPVEISELLWKLAPDHLYGTAFQVALSAAGIAKEHDRTNLRIYPEIGRFSFISSVPVGTIVTNYTFGLLMPLGAGGFNQSILSALVEPASTAPLLTGGNAIANGLNTALANAATNPAILFGDSFTYVGPTQQLNVPDGATVLFGTANPGAVGNLQRPVLRWLASSPKPPKPTWTIAGEKVARETTLILQGILLQGADVILTGNFDAVYLRMITMDPGTAFSATPSNIPEFFDSAIDGLALSPGTIWIEGIVTQLTVERSFLGPIRTRNGGTLEQLVVTDSVIQSIPTHVVGGGAKLTAQTVQTALFDATSLAGDLANKTSTLATNTVNNNAGLQAALVGYAPNTPPSSTLLSAIQEALVGIPVAEAEQAWPLALADLALGFSDGAVSLSRTTILGPTYTHQLAASESVLDSFARVENPQSGCVRFCAYAVGSNLHQPFRSVVIPNQAAIFESKRFGQPEYARLRDDADLQILPQSGGSSCGAIEPAVMPTILKGAQNGSEMGVCCLAQLPLKHQGLAFKFEEYAPVGHLPVWIDVD